MEPIKATVLDDDHFRLLAIPFTGPLPGGNDIDGQRFTPRTNIYPGLLPARLVDWHHGKDPLMGRTILGKATLDEEPEEDGWWVDVWMKHGEKRLDLIRRLAEKQPIYGSSEALWVKASADGEITEWPYWRQTLSTSPQNTHSIVRPAQKAVLGDYHSAGIAVDGRVKSFIDDLDALGIDLRSTSLSGEDAAKAGRVLATRNESRLREAEGLLDGNWYSARVRQKALDLIRETLGELERYTTPQET